MWHALPKVGEMTDNIREGGSGLSPIEDVIADAAAGRLFILVDAEARENEGDLVMAASKVTADAVNQMALHARGLICVPLLSDQLRRLGINSMSSENRESQQTDFAVSVDAAEGITTGISAQDRAETSRILAAPTAAPTNNFCF